MIREYLLSRIETIAHRANIIVLKGFDNTLIQSISTEYEWLDSDVLCHGHIDLQRVNALGLITRLLAPSDHTSIVTYETFLDLTIRMRNLADFGKTFCVLTNNLLTRYINPTLENIPDFDHIEEDEEEANAPYQKFYSYCEHIEGRQYVQYVNYYLENEGGVIREYFIKPAELRVQPGNTEVPSQHLSDHDGTADDLLSSIYHEDVPKQKSFVFDKSPKDNYRLKVLQGASDAFALNLTFYEQVPDIHATIRPELYTIMERVWGYTSFRDLNMYKNLVVNREVTQLSQGEIIETVVRQAENAITGKETMHNVLLTSPTGAGKSLLFQLAAIYLAEAHQALTIVISPLVALMNDQVQNLVGNYRGVATLNGNMTPSQKEDVIESVKSGEVNILYLAPELLLSYRISTFIDQRSLGLVVVDEAHTVTTWGRDFRIDYWFLGDYIRREKRQLGYSFPIFALTATAVWDPKGDNDMVFDTIQSLYMDPCITYIGVVRRDDIRFDIQQVKFKYYESERKALTIQRIHEFWDQQSKTIIYFPYTSLIRDIVRDRRMDDCHEYVAQYYAGLPIQAKKEYAADFKTGRKPIMCATKAYGMGIDVSDIETVYHHAPTGCLSDYVQEIGRVARDPNITGVAKIDFYSSGDFRYTHTLHGLSTIKSYQLLAVLRKLMELFHMNKEKRNLLISAADFAYIFQGKDVDYDQKVKSCLMLISHDLLNKLGFHALIVRPKNIFKKTYIRVSEQQVDDFSRKYNQYLTPTIVDTVFMLQADNLWNECYSQLSFPQFKYRLATGGIFGQFNTEIMNRIVVMFDKRLSEIKNELEKFFRYTESFLERMACDGHRMKLDEMRQKISADYPTDDAKDGFIEAFMYIYAPQNTKKNDRYCTIYHEFGSVQLNTQAYERPKSIYLKLLQDELREEQTVYFCSPEQPLIKLLEVLSILNLLSYQRFGGEDPSIFVRINNPNYLNNLVRRKKYDNGLLNDIYRKYEYSERVFTYFFTTEMSDKQRWDFIEAYFLGATEEELFSIGK